MTSHALGSDVDRFAPERTDRHVFDQQLDTIDGANQRTMRPLKAFVLAPLTAPTLYWFISLGSAIADPNRRYAAFNGLLTSFAAVMAFGAPISYAATFAFGGPAYVLLGRRNALRLGPIVLVGTFAGLITALVVQPQLRGDLFSVSLGPLHGLTLGGASAFVFWWCLRFPTTHPQRNA